MTFNTDLNTPKSELDRRIANLKIHLAEASIEAALILQRPDLYYFSGTVQQGALYVPAKGKPVLMANKNSERAMAESALEDIFPLASPKQIPEILRRFGHAMPSGLGMELDVLPANLMFAYQKLFSDSKIVDFSPDIRLIRAVKSPYEIDIMRTAARLSDEVAGCVPGLLREGMTERELAGKVEAEARKRGHQGTVRMRLWGSEMFYGHLLSGSSGAVPSFLSSPTGGTGASPAVAQGSGFKQIQRHEPILVDYVFAWRGYGSDHARIFSLGELPAELTAAHKAMLQLQEQIKKWAKPGRMAGEIYERSLAFAKDLGYGDNFMGAGSERIRFVGHGIGLEVDEFPFLAAGQNLELQENMTIALEPKLIFPGQGVVGIENTHMVTRNGLEQLSCYEEDIIVV